MEPFGHLTRTKKGNIMIGATLLLALTVAPAQLAPANDSCRKRDVVLLFNDVALNAIRAERTPPPIAARNLAIVHVAVYDAVNAVYRTHQPFAVSLNPPAVTSPDAAAAVAAHRTLLGLYPKYQCDLNEALNDCLAFVPEGEAKRNGINLGQSVAEKILDWRSKDLAPARIAYTPQSVLGHWQRTPPNYDAPLLPEWQTRTPFGLRDMAEFRPAGPPKLDSDEFIDNFRQVKELGANNSTTRTREQTEIAKFWEDGAGTVTPPGHWNRIAQTIAADRKLSLAENARLFALLNVTLADAGIACWDCKYRFDFWRPVTAIREAARLNNPALVADPNWLPLLPTPPFPSYTSGHSSFSGSAAAALTAFFGTDEVRFATTSEGLAGVTRVFNRFSDAAAEAGMSRIYGGIHWDFDNRDGLSAGRALGEYESQHHFRALNLSSSIDDSDKRRFAEASRTPRLLEASRIDSTPARK